MICHRRGSGNSNSNIRKQQEKNASELMRWLDKEHSEKHHVHGISGQPVCTQHGPTTQDPLHGRLIREGQRAQGHNGARKHVRDHLVNVCTRARKSICLAYNLKRDGIVHKLAT